MPQARRFTVYGRPRPLEPHRSYAKSAVQLGALVHGRFCQPG